MYPQASQKRTTHVAESHHSQYIISLIFIVRSASLCTVTNHNKMCQKFEKVLFACHTRQLGYLRWFVFKMICSCGEKQHNTYKQYIYKNRYHLFMWSQHLLPLFIFLLFYYVQLHCHQSWYYKLFFSSSFLHAVYCLLKNAKIKMNWEKMSWRSFILSLFPRGGLLICL